MLKAMTRQQIADKLGIHRSTLDRKCKQTDIPIPSRTLIMPKTYKLIFEYFGVTDEENTDQKKKTNF